MEAEIVSLCNTLVVSYLLIWTHWVYSISDKQRAWQILRFVSPGVWLLLILKTPNSNTSASLVGLIVNSLRLLRGTQTINFYHAWYLHLPQSPPRSHDTSGRISGECCRNGQSSRLFQHSQSCLVTIPTQVNVSTHGSANRPKSPASPMIPK